MDDFINSQANQNPEQISAMDQYTHSLSDEPEPSALDKIISAGKGALGQMGRALGYAGGQVRTRASAPVLDYLQSHGYQGIQPITQQDIDKANSGYAPTSSELLQRAGVPSGPSLYSILGDLIEKGGPADVTARGAAGLGLDMATDPLTYASLGSNQMAKRALQAGEELSPAEKIAQYGINPTGSSLQGAGENLYKSAFNKIDQSALNAGQKPMSDVFIQNGMPIVNYRGIQDSAENLKNEIGKNLSDIRKTAANGGASIDMLPAMNDAMEKAYEWRKDPHPEIQAAGQKLDQITDSYMGRGNAVPVDLASKWATSVNDLAKKVFNNKEAPFSSEGDAEIGQGISQSIKDEISKNPELSDKYNLGLNQYSALSGKKANESLDSLVKTEAAKKMFTPLDWALGGLGGEGIAHGHELALLPIAAKKTGEILNTPAARTAIGKSLYGAGMFSDPVLRQRSVWQDILNKKGDQDAKDSTGQ